MDLYYVDNINNYNYNIKNNINVFIGLQTNNFFSFGTIGYSVFYFGFGLSATLFTDLGLGLDITCGFSLAGLDQLELSVSGLDISSRVGVYTCKEL